MTMPRITIVTGVALIILALGFYLGLLVAHEGAVSLTALIPAIPGALLVVLGVLAEARPTWRKHLMHVAMLLGVLVVLAGLGMGLPALGRGLTAAAIEQTLMGLIGLVFVGVGVKSFIDARRARESNKPQP